MSVHDRPCRYCGETTSPGVVHSCPAIGTARLVGRWIVPGHDRAEEINSIYGAGLICAALLGVLRDGGIAVSVLRGTGGDVGNQLLVKVPGLGGAAAELGYLVTVTIPTGDEVAVGFTE